MLRIKRLEVEFQEYLTGMAGTTVLWNHNTFLMIIGKFDVMDITINPTKDNSELIVNLNRMKSRQIAYQCFESIAGRNFKS